jgi:hypothetical protein
MEILKQSFIHQTSETLKPLLQRYKNLHTNKKAATPVREEYVLGEDHPDQATD